MLSAKYDICITQIYQKNKQPTIALNTAQDGNISSFVSISADLCEVSSAVFTIL